MSNPETQQTEGVIDLESLQRGAALHAEGKLKEAEALYRSLLSGPAQQAAMAHYLLALVLTDWGDTREALRHGEAAIELGAASGDLFFQCAELLRTLNRPQEALAYYDRAVVLEPQIRTYWNNRGIVLEALNRCQDAVESYDHALLLDPEYVQARHNRGSALLRLGRMEEALTSFDEALELNSSIPECWNFRAVVLATLERHEEALTSTERALTLRPDYPEAHNNRSIALRALKRPQDALAAADAALAARPDFAEALNSRGSALVKLNRFEEAKTAYRLAVGGKPNDAAMQLNLGLALEALGDLDGAQTAFAASERLAPSVPDASFASGLTHIRAGNVQEGFRKYETRWTQKGGPRHQLPKESLWLGQTPLGDRTLLVHAEQGFGDVIQFSRFAPLAAQPQRLILQVQAPLTRLLSSLDGVGQIVPVGEPPPRFDVHIPIMSLPLALDLGLKDLAPHTPYLHASPSLVEEWRRRLPDTDDLRVGLVWSGNPGHDNDHNRSMTLAMLQPLLEQKAQFISLQRDYRLEDSARLRETPQLLSFDQALSDFAETAALVACCDLVIAVDTAVAHLAGALGKPLWLMLPHFADWRWMNDREDSPWYPTAVLVRQDEFGIWDSVVSRIADRLNRLIRET